MKVKDIMTKSLVKTKTGYTIREVSRFLLKHHLNSMPVVDDENRLLGIITQADIFRATLLSYEDICKEGIYMEFEEIEERAGESARKKVEEVMNKPVVTVKEDTSVVKAGSTLLLRGIKQLPVVRDEKLVGIVTLTDVIEALIISNPKKYST